MMAREGRARRLVTVLPLALMAVALMAVAALPVASLQQRAAVSLAPALQSTEAIESPEEQFQEGNRRYQAGDFEGALTAYLGILKAGFESGDLQYNLGNTYFKLGDLGHAILSYERARRALPHDENVRSNLALARSLTVDKITPLPGFWVPKVVRWWVDLMPRTILIALVAIGYLTVTVCLFLRVVNPGAGPWPGRLAVALGIVTLVFAIPLTVRELGLGRTERGVVLATEAAVQSAPSEDPSLQLFTIHEGTVVRVDRRAEGWLEVVLEDGKVGWIRSETLERI